MEDSRKEMIPLNEKDLEEVSGGSASVALTTNSLTDTTPEENDVKARAMPIISYKKLAELSGKW